MKKRSMVDHQIHCTNKNKFKSIGRMKPPILSSKTNFFSSGKSSLLPMRSSLSDSTSVAHAPLSSCSSLLRDPSIMKCSPVSYSTPSSGSPLPKSLSSSYLSSGSPLLKDPSISMCSPASPFLRDPSISMCLPVSPLIRDPSIIECSPVSYITPLSESPLPKSLSSSYLCSSSPLLGDPSISKCSPVLDLTTSSSGSPIAKSVSLAGSSSCTPVLRKPSLSKWSPVSHSTPLPSSPPLLRDPSLSKISPILYSSPSSSGPLSDSSNSFLLSSPSILSNSSLLLVPLALENSSDPSLEEEVIRDVWSYNLEAEFHHIRQIVKNYHYIAMDTEFPGVVGFTPEEQRIPQLQYHITKTNVNSMRLIQLGLTFMNEMGETPPGISTWQFNFKFDVENDIQNKVSVNMLRTCGLQFDKHRDIGIDSSDFAELLTSSGIVLVDNIHWLCFQSGYDFAYLIKILTGSNLPDNESEFFDILAMYCPVVYDIKYLTKKKIRGGLQDLANMLSVKRIGSRHQAGSDALITGMTYFELIRVRKDIDIYNCVKKIMCRNFPVPLFVAPNVDISKYRYT